VFAGVESCPRDGGKVRSTGRYVRLSCRGAERAIGFPVRPDLGRNRAGCHGAGALTRAALPVDGGQLHTRRRYLASGLGPASPALRGANRLIVVKSGNSLDYPRVVARDQSAPYRSSRPP
jgi:hypothetical protein